MVCLADLISRSMTGNVCSPLSKISMRFPEVIAASVCASIVGKNAGSPRVTGGTCRTGRTLAHPKDNKIKNNPKYLIVVIRPILSNYQFSGSARRYEVVVQLDRDLSFCSR